MFAKATAAVKVIDCLYKLDGFEERFKKSILIGSRFEWLIRLEIQKRRRAIKRDLANVVPIVEIEDMPEVVTKRMIRHADKHQLHIYEQALKFGKQGDRDELLALVRKRKMWAPG